MVGPNLLTDESRWLAKQLRMQRMAIHNANSSSFYNTPRQYSLLSADTMTFNADTLHSISFSVIKGSVMVSFDGGSTTVTYPIGSNVRIDASSLIATEIQFFVSGSPSDGLNQVIIQTLTI